MLNDLTFHSREHAGMATVDGSAVIYNGRRILQMPNYFLSPAGFRQELVALQFKCPKNRPVRTNR